MNRPPVHSIHVPVTYDDNGLARNSITFAASCAVPGLARGISDTSRHFFAWSGIPGRIAWPFNSSTSDSVGGRVMRVSIQPYATAFARTLYLWMIMVMSLLLISMGSHPRLSINIPTPF